MNSLDFFVILAIFYFVTRVKVKSLVYISIGGLGLMVGYLFGLLLTAVAARSLGLGLATGILYLAVPLVLALAAGYLGHIAGSRIRMRVMITPFANADSKLAFPSKAVAALLSIYILSQTLPYIPFTNLQFVAQGSTLMFSTRKLLPESPLDSLARQIYPGEFSDITNPTDPHPVTFENIMEEADLQEVVDRVAPSVVKVVSEGCQYSPSGGRGTGFFVAPNYVLTNAHVVAGAVNIYIKTRDGSYPATPVYINDRKDTAVLFTMFMEGRPLEFAERTPAAADTEVFVMGYPGGGDLKTSRGKVLERGHYGFTDRSDLTHENTTGTDAKVIPGNSGSPLLNYEGEVLGLINSGSGELGIAIDSDYIEPIMEEATSKLITTKTGLCDVFDGL